MKLFIITYETTSGEDAYHGTQFLAAENKTDAQEMADDMLRIWYGHTTRMDEDGNAWEIGDTRKTCIFAVLETVKLSTADNHGKLHTFIITHQEENK